MASTQRFVRGGRVLGAGVLGATMAGAVALSVVGVSCGGPRGGTDVGNGASISVDVQGIDNARLTTSKPPRLLLANGVVLDEAWLGVERFKLLANGKCLPGPSQGEPDILGPFVANLLGGGVVGTKPEATVPKGQYCGLQLGLRDVEPALVPSSAPPDLADMSLYISGERADGTPFVVKTSRTINLRLVADADDPFDLRDGEPFILGIDLKALVASLDLDSIEGPSVVISDTTNASHLAGLDRALRSTAALFEDQDGNGTLSADEVDEADRLAEGDQGDQDDQ